MKPADRVLTAVLFWTATLITVGGAMHAEISTINVVNNFEPQDCDEQDLNNARAYLALRTEVAALRAELDTIKAKEADAAQRERDRSVLEAILDRHEKEKA